MKDALPSDSDLLCCNAFSKSFNPKTSFPSRWASFFNENCTQQSASSNSAMGRFDWFGAAAPPLSLCAHGRQSLERVARFRLGESAPAAHAAACHAAAALLTTAGGRGSSRPNASDSASKSPDPWRDRDPRVLTPLPRPGKWFYYESPAGRFSSPILHKIRAIISTDRF